MKLLICTQAYEANDPALGFFVGWVSALAAQYEQVTVICLRKGEHTLPANVRVFGLGGGNKILRAYKLLRGAYKFRNNYDTVFVHMNQEYLLAAGWFWRLLGKKVFLWRNHYAGSLLTDLAVAYCHAVFATSKHSYTAKFKKTILMPVGVDTVRFAPIPGVVRTPNTILSLGRITKSKRLEMLLDAQHHVPFTATVVGPASRSYLAELKGRAGNTTTFKDPIPNEQTPALYNSHEVFVNCSPSGMFDKTLFEAAACGCLVLATSDDWAAHAGEEWHVTDTQSLIAALRRIADLSPEQKESHSAVMRSLAQAHSLDMLVEKLIVHMTHHVRN